MFLATILNDSRGDLEANNVFLVGLQRPVHDELDLRVNLEHVEHVFVDVSLSLQQRARSLLAILFVDIIAS